MTVRSTPKRDKPQPIFVTIERAFVLIAVCDTSSNNAKLVKWLHAQVVWSSSLCSLDRSHPRFDQAPLKPGIEVAEKKKHFSSTFSHHIIQKCFFQNYLQLIHSFETFQMSKHKQEESVYQNLWLWPVAYIIVTRPQHLRLKKLM